jgi:hypothetical protein
MDRGIEGAGWSVHTGSRSRIMSREVEEVKTRI